MLLSLSSLSLMHPALPALLGSQATESDPLFSSALEAASSLNMYLAEIGKTPYSQSKTHSKNYSRQVKKIIEAL